MPFWLVMKFLILDYFFTIFQALKKFRFFFTFDNNKNINIKTKNYNFTTSYSDKYKDYFKNFGS